MRKNILVLGGDKFQNDMNANIHTLDYCIANIGDRRAATFQIYLDCYLHWLPPATCISIVAVHLMYKRV